MLARLRARLERAPLALCFTSWRAYVTAHPEYSRGWAASCSRLKNESRLVETWTQLWAERATLAGAQYVSAHQAWDKGVFSYHVVRDGCSGAELRQTRI